MINFERVNKEKEMLDLAVLPETSIRLEAAYYELMDEIMEKIPSANLSDWFSAPSIQTSTYYQEAGSKDYVCAVYTQFSMDADFDDVMDHATNMDIHMIEAEFMKSYKRRGIVCCAKITVTAKMHPEYLETLRSLGKTRTDSGGYCPPPREEVYCPIPSVNDNIPF